MANVMDYVDWRGDIPLSVSPFNEVDNLILCLISFIDLNGILPERACDGVITLEQAVARYLEAYPDDETPLGLIVPPQTRPLMRRLAESERFRHMRMRAFVDHIDENAQKQLAAMTFELDEKDIFVVFRGTDDTLVGWKENFNMSFLTAIPAQLEAVAYLNSVASDLPDRRILLGGHSKGGNLAIYAAIHASDEVKSRIVQVYSNDGPGYRREVVDSPEYQAMHERIINIIPQSSVVGRMLEHGERYTPVMSSAQGLWQHDGFSWEVKGTSFVTAPSLSQDSEMIDQSLKKWTADMSDEQLEQLVDSMYRILTATNAKTLSELTRDRNWFWHLLSSSDPQSRKTVLTALSQLTGEAGRLWLERVLPALIKSKTVQTSSKAIADSEASDKALISEPSEATSDASENETVPQNGSAERSKDPIDRVLTHIIAKKHEKAKNGMQGKSKCASCPKRESCPKLAARRQDK